MTGNEAVLAVIDALEACGVSYMIVGSYSSNVYGIDRSTEDADFVVELGDVSIREIGRRLAPNIRIDPQMSFETVTMTRRYIAQVVGEIPFKIEFFLLSNDPHDQERFRRRLPSRVAGRETFLPTPEDVIITKLNWYARQRRAKDLEDARGIIGVQEEKALDWAYIRSWCDRHGTRELLEEVRRSIPPID